MVYPRKKLKTQQLVIPKGAIGPNEVAVIEIPRRYRRTPTIIVRNKPSGLRSEERAEKFFVPGPTKNQSPAPSPPPRPPPQYPASISLFSNDQQTVGIVDPQKQFQVATVNPAQPSYSFSPYPSRNPPEINSHMMVSSPATLLPVNYTPQRVPTQLPSTSNPAMYMVNPHYSRVIPTQSPIISYRNQCMPYPSPAPCPLDMNYNNIDLVEKEQREQALLKRSLEEFQETRRMFLRDAFNLADQLRNKKTKSVHYESNSSSE